MSSIQFAARESTEQDSATEARPGYVLEDGRDALTEEQSFGQSSNV